MKVMNFVEVDEVLKTLNTPAPSAHAEVAFIRELDKTPAREFGDEWAPYLRAELGSSLRYLVDPWLATGKQQDGRESVASRNLLYAREASYALKAYMERYPATVDLASDGSELHVCIAEVCALPPPSLNPYCDLRLEATRLFLGLMTSDWKLRLCKCVHCSKYFLHDHPRQVYTNGTFCCRQHQSHFCALKSTKTSRVLAKTELLRFAAEHLVNSKVSGPEWQENPQIKARLATQISRHILKSGIPLLKSYAQIVKSNWVTRNRHEIEQKRIELARLAQSHRAQMVSDQSAATEVNSSSLQREIGRDRRGARNARRLL